MPADACHQKLHGVEGLALDNWKHFSREPGDAVRVRGVAERADEENSDRSGWVRLDCRLRDRHRVWELNQLRTRCFGQGIGSGERGKKQPIKLCNGRTLFRLGEFGQVVLSLRLDQLI